MSDLPNPAPRGRPQGKLSKPMGHPGAGDHTVQLGDGRLKYLIPSTLHEAAKAMVKSKRTFPARKQAHLTTGRPTGMICWRCGLQATYGIEDGACTDLAACQRRAEQWG